MIRESGAESALELAAKRLERAVASLEAKLAERGATPAPAAPQGGLFDQSDDRNQLAAELEKSRQRERELEAAGAEASEALGRAIAEIKAALAGQSEAAE